VDNGSFRIEYRIVHPGSDDAHEIASFQVIQFNKFDLLVTNFH